MFALHIAIIKFKMSQKIRKVTDVCSVAEGC